MLAVLLLVAGVFYFWWRFAPASSVPVARFEIVNEYPHDRQAYCQGLVYEDGHLYEGTGKYGESSLRRIVLETGEITAQQNLDRRYFGEGIAIWKDRIIQLTWKERAALVYDKQTLQPARDSFHYKGEGWGLTSDGESLIMSDGTSVLRFLDPDTFQITRRLTVQEGRRRVSNLNELEYIDGEIYANIWKADYIVRISPRTGKVTGRINLEGLRRRLRLSGDDDVLNGIAYDPDKNRLFVTGKNWPSLFEIRVIP